MSMIIFPVSKSLDTFMSFSVPLNASGSLDATLEILARISYLRSSVILPCLIARLNVSSYYSFACCLTTPLSFLMQFFNSIEGVCAWVVYALWIGYYGSRDCWAAAWDYNVDYVCMVLVSCYCCPPLRFSCVSAALVVQSLLASGWLV